MVNKRSRFLIDKDFQLRFVGSFLLLIVLAFFVFSLAVTAYYWVRYMAGENVFREFIFIQRQVDKVDERGVRTTTTEDVPPVNRVEIVLPPILLNNAVILVLTAVIGVRYSHRIAGAAHRVCEDVERSLRGERDVQVRLRRRDKLQRLAGQVNRLLAELDRYR
jgi:hypothetical protein